MTRNIFILQGELNGKIVVVRFFFFVGYIRNRHNQVPHLAQDTTWESDKQTRKHHTQESQEVSPFPAGDHKATMNRQESMTNKKQK